MKQFASFIMMILCLVLLIASKQVDSPSQGTIHTQIQSKQSIEGTWKLTSANWTEQTEQYAEDDMYKIYTQDRFAFIYFDSEANTYSGAGGGTYSIEGDQLIESLEYFSFDQTAVGSQQGFSISFSEEGNLHQLGVLDTEEFSEYQIDEWYERVEEGIHTEDNSHPLLGIWAAEKATYGDDISDAAALQKKYGKVYKIITPRFFYSAFFDPERKYLNGVGFGSYEISGDNYTETIMAYSWDNASVGSQPSFTWEIKDGKFYQTGELDAGNYKKYKIEEVFRRLE